MSLLFLSACIALILIFYTTGRKKWIAYGIFASILLPLVMLISGYTVLAELRLTWQTWFYMLSMAALFLGEAALLAWIGVFLWGLAEFWEIFVRWIYRSVVLTGIGFLCLASLSLGFLFLLLGSSAARQEGRVDEINGQKVIWLYDDKAYYTYYGPFIRGKARLDLEQFEVETDANKY